MSITALALRFSSASTVGHSSLVGDSLRIRPSDRRGKSVGRIRDQTRLEPIGFARASQSREEAKDAPGISGLGGAEVGAWASGVVYRLFVVMSKETNCVRRVVCMHSIVVRVVMRSGEAEGRADDDSNLPEPARAFEGGRSGCLGLEPSSSHLFTVDQTVARPGSGHRS